MSHAHIPDWDKLPRLTRRELEVMEQVCEGYVDDDISAELSIAQRTIENHLRSVYSKWGVPGRAQAIVAALKFGVVKPVWLQAKAGA